MRQAPLRRARALVMLACGASLLLSSGRARAQDAEDLLQEAIVLYTTARPEQSLRKLQKALKATKQPKLLARIHLYTGLDHLLLGDGSEAKKAFARALRQDPTVELDPKRFKPEWVQLLDGVRAQLKGRLRVTADRPKATVLIDGKSKGTAPFSGQLVVGRHRVVVRTRDALYSHRSAVVIHADQQHTVAAELTFSGGRLTAESQPPGARVSLGERVLGETPLQAIPLPAGKHQLRFELAGAKAQTTTVEIVRGQTAKIEVKLETAEQLSRSTEREEPSAGSAARKVRTQAAPARQWPLWTIIAASAALAVAGVGIGIGVASNAAFQEYKETLDQERYWTLQSRISTFDTVANVSFGVAGALAAGAVALYFLVDRPAAERRTIVSAAADRMLVRWKF